MNLNVKQILGAIGVVLSVLVVSTAQLTDIFGPAVAKSIVSAAALANGMVSGWIMLVTGQAATVKEVAAMTGVEGIEVNAKANKTLAAVATDPEQPKIGGTDQHTQNILEQKASGEIAS